MHTPMTDHLLSDAARLQVIEGQHPLGYVGQDEDIVYLASTWPRMSRRG